MTSAQERFPKIRRWGPFRLIPINHGPEVVIKGRYESEPGPYRLASAAFPALAEQLELPVLWPFTSFGTFSREG